MGTPGPHETAFLFAALFSHDQAFIARGVSSLGDKFGIPESSSGIYEFDETEY